MKMKKQIVWFVGGAVALAGLLSYGFVLKKQLRVRDLFAEAKSAHMNGELPRAAETFRKLLGIDPENEKSRILLAIVLMDQNLWDEAEKELVYAVEKNPNKTGAYGFLASLYFEKGDLEKAELNARKSLAINPQSGADITLGRVAMARKDMEEAEKQFESHTQSWPANADGFVYLAKVKAELGKTDEAVANYEKAVKLDPRLDKYILEAGKLYEDEGEYQKAVDLYKRTKTYLVMESIESALKKAEAKLGSKKNRK